MALKKIAVTIPRKSGITADSVVNTFWIDDGIEGVPFSITDAATFINRFFNGTGSPALPGDISYYLSDCLSHTTNACTVTMTHVDKDTGFQVGVAEKAAWTLEDHASGGAGWTGSLPSEVACVATFMGEHWPEKGPGDSRPMSRHRGRVYIGPVGRLALYDDPTTGETTWASAFRTAVKDAMVRFKADCDTTTGKWVVYSRRLRIATPVDRGFVNNNPDIQRRRGVLPSSKTEWP